MTDFRILVDDDDADRVLRRLVVGLSDLRPFWPRVSRLAIGWLRLQFDSEGAFWGVGTRWTPLSPAYAAAKFERWGARPILQASGQMRRAFSNPERRATPRSLTLTFDDSGPQHGEIAQYHQEGQGVPRRPIIGDRLPPLAELELQREADDYVRDLLGPRY